MRARGQEPPIYSVGQVGLDGTVFQADLDRGRSVIPTDEKEKKVKTKRI